MNFCLSSEAFQDNAYSIETIYEKINNLTEIYNKIDHTKDKIYRDDNTLYITDIFNGIELYKFLLDPTIEKYYKTKLRILLDQKTIPLNNEDIIREIGLHKISDNVICTLRELINFFYQNLETINDENEFLAKIKLYFPELEFHSDINDTLSNIYGSLSGFAKSIIKSLEYLRDNLQICIDDSQNLDEALKRFSAISGFPTTLEGTSNPKIKKIMSFRFNEKLICCEPHIKLHHSSIVGDNKFYQNRIHFHQADSDIEDGKILIGHIGKHLKIKKKKRKK